MEDITDVDCSHARIYKYSETKNLGEYHDLNVQSDILLLADVFENIRNMHINLYGFHPTIFFQLQD